MRVRLVGSGLGSSPGCGGFLSLSQTRLPSLRKGKESCRGVRGEVSGSGGSAGDEASGSDILTGYRFLCCSGSGLLRRCTSKKRKEGYTSCMAECMWGWGGVQRGGLTGGGAEQQYPAIKGRWQREEERFYYILKVDIPKPVIYSLSHKLPRPLSFHSDISFISKQQ